MSINFIFFRTYYLFNQFIKNRQENFCNWKCYIPTAKDDNSNYDNSIFRKEGITREWICSTVQTYISTVSQKLKQVKAVINMKPERPWMLAHLKIIWQFHAHPVHQKVSRFFGPRYIGDDLFLGPNLVSFKRAVVPLLELSAIIIPIFTNVYTPTSNVCIG